MAVNPFTRENIAHISDPKVAERLIGKAREKGKAIMVESAYATIAGHRTGLTNAHMSTVWEKSTSTVTLYRRLGAYLMAGGEPTGDLWKLLSNKSKANHKPSGLADLLDADSVDVKAVEKAAWDTFLPDGKPKVAPVTTPKTGEGEVPPMEEAKAIVARLDKITRGFAADDWSVVETLLSGLIGRKVKTLAAAAAAEEKADAPKPKAPVKA